MGEALCTLHNIGCSAHSLAESGPNLGFYGSKGLQDTSGRGRRRGVLHCESSIMGSRIPACVHLRVCLCVQINDYWRKKCHRLVFYTNNLELCDSVRKCPRGGNMTFVVLCYSLHPSLSSSSVAPVHLSHPTNDCSVALGPPCII